jgi:HK97 family phage prohead protease
MAKYDAAQIDAFAKSGIAMPDGSYPIADQDDLEKAIDAVGRSGDSHNEVRVHIIKRAKALGLSKLIPADWAANGALDLHPTSVNSAEHPKDNLIRAVFRQDAIESDGRTLYGHFAVFNSPTEINDAYEGRFIEQIAPGAFARTLKERAGQIKVLFNHGQDPSIGNKPLGTIRSVSEDRTGVAYDVQLFDDTSYVKDLLPGLRAGAYGASFRFGVVAESWETSGAMDERTITDLNLYEFGPVTFPAYADATAGVRSMTGEFADRLLHDPLFLARFIERTGRSGLKMVEELNSTPPAADEMKHVDAGSDDVETRDEDEAFVRRLERHKRRTAGFEAYLANLDKE